MMLKDGGSLAPLAVELVDSLAIFVVARRFQGMVASSARSLCREAYARREYFSVGPLAPFLGG
jgi:hypothetical protein